MPPTFIDLIKLSKRYECSSCFCEAFTNAGTPGKALRLFVYIYIFLFVCRFHSIYFIGIQIFNNGRRKFSKIPLDSAYKYATRSHNAKAKRVINERAKRVNHLLIGKFTLLV